MGLCLYICKFFTRFPWHILLLNGQTLLIALSTWFRFKTGLSKKMTCLQGLAAMPPNEAPQLKLISASSTIGYERSRMAEINFFSKNICRGHKIVILIILFSPFIHLVFNRGPFNMGRDFC